MRRRARWLGWPVVQRWPGRRIGGGRVGDAIARRERQTDALRGVRRLVVVEGGVMPVDPPPACGWAAQMPERVLVSGEGADRDQAPKRVHRRGAHTGTPLAMWCSCSSTWTSGFGCAFGQRHASVSSPKEASITRSGPTGLSTTLVLYVLSTSLEPIATRPHRAQSQVSRMRDPHVRF